MSAIGPAATVVAYLLSLASVRELVEDRVATKHKFSRVTAQNNVPRGWANGARAITLRLAGSDGPPDESDCAEHRVRLEARYWGESPEGAELVWVTLAPIFTSYRRGPVTLPDGRRALLQYLFPLDGPYAEMDPDTGLDYVRATLRAGVAGETV